MKLDLNKLEALRLAISLRPAEGGMSAYPGQAPMGRAAQSASQVVADAKTIHAFLAESPAKKARR